jgi:hypothetical protein
MPLQTIKSIHVHAMFGLALGLITKCNLRRHAPLRKAALITQSLFRLSKEECDENLRKRKHGYHATVMLLEDKFSLPYVLIEPSEQMAKNCSYDVRYPKIQKPTEVEKPT